MQIKVKDTRMQNVTYYNSELNLGTKDNVLVVEGKLVLVECSDNEVIHHQLKTMGDYLKPIIVSEIEEIEEGDWILLKNQIQKAGKDGIKNWKEASEYHNWSCYKILALSEHFSPKYIQAIVDRKFKDGDKILVECKYFCNRDCQADLGDCCHPSNCGKESIIKINQSNHITLHKAEVKMYTREEVRKILRFYVGGIIKHTEEWFEQNVK